MRTEKVKIKKDALLDYDKHTHPSFGVIGISNVTGEATLVGSSVKHGHFISLTIKESVKYRNGYHESFMGKKTVCEVLLSSTQLAEMLFSANHGDGVPCTIRYVAGDNENRRPEPPFESPMKQHTDDLNSALQKTLQYAKDLAKEAQTLAKGKLSTKKDREQMEFLTMKIVQDIEANLKYASESIDKKMEKNIQHAKAEVEAFVESKLRAAGIEHVKAHAPRLITSEDDK